MLQYTDNEEKALSVVVPYLLQFPEIYGLAKNSGTRYQNIEDVAWELLYNLDINSANGYWLDCLGRKVGQSRLYAPTATGAFTFGGTSLEGFGAGKFMKSALIGPNTKTARSDAYFRNAIRAKIIENNTDCSLDELKAAIKFLYNASIVIITEAYPAGISNIDIWGSTILETVNANSEIKKMMPAGVSLTHVNFYNTYNLFRNNAFINYGSNYLIPSSDDFTLSFNFYPTLVNSSNIPLLSQSSSYASDYSSVGIYYNSTDGIVFGLAPSIYNIGDGNSQYYDNGASAYYSNAGALTLNGGTVNQGEINTVKITKLGTTYKLFLNGIEVDSEVSGVTVGNSIGYGLFLGAVNNSYFNHGSIYNLYLYNNTTNTLIVNDALKTQTNFGTNNGVLFI